MRRYLAAVVVGALALATSLGGSHAASAHSAARHQASAAPYQFQAVTNPNDPTFTQLLGINDHGVIAGYYGSGQTVNGTLHPNKGFTMTLPNSFTPENFPNSAQTQIIAIDNLGDTAGFYIDQAGATHGFLNNGGAFTIVDLPGTTFNQLLGLNNHGQAAGYFQDAQGQNHAFIRDAHGTFLVLSIPNSQATGINDAGVVVGFTQPTTTTSSAFILQNEHVRIIRYPGSTFTQALGENDRGQIVGTYNDSAGMMHGYIYFRGHFKSIDVPGASATVINGINNAGRIVGFYADTHGNTIGVSGVPTSGNSTLQGGTTGGTGTVTGGAGMMTGTTPQSTTVTIGLVLPLSGQDAALGRSAEDGVRLAIDQANAARLVPSVLFKLDARDDAGAGGLPDGATGASDVRALIGDGRVAGIIGPFDTATALKELPLANQAPIAMISPSAGNPCLTVNDPALGCSGQNALLATVRPTGMITFFRTIPTDDQQGAAQADFLFKTKGFHKAYIIDDQTAYGTAVATGFSQEWTKLGGQVLGHVSVVEGTTSFVNLLTQIAAGSPDVLFFGGADPASGAPASIVLRQQMLQVPGLTHATFAGTDGIRTTMQFTQTIGATDGGPVYSTLTPTDAGFVAPTSPFVQQYQMAYGAPGRYSASGYDAATALLAAIKLAIATKVALPTQATDPAATFRQAVITALGQVNLTGALGQVSFAANGDLITGNGSLATARIGIEQLVAGAGSSIWKQLA